MIIDIQCKECSEIFRIVTSGVDVLPGECGSCKSKKSFFVIDKINEDITIDVPIEDSLNANFSEVFLEDKLPEGYRKISVIDNYALFEDEDENLYQMIIIERDNKKFYCR